MSAFNGNGILILLLGSSLLIFVLLINVLIFYVIINSAIKKTVKPELEKNGLLYVNYKWTGFWGCGDFRDKVEFALFKTSYNTSSVYSFIYYKKGDIMQRMTIKINLTNLKIDEVLYSREL